MYWHDLLLWMWHAARRACIRSAKQPPPAAKKKKAEDEPCEGRATPTTVRIWQESDAYAIERLPPGPGHIRFTAGDFWKCIRGGKAVGLVAEQAGKVVGVLATKQTDQGTQLAVRFAVAGHCAGQGIEEQLLEFLATLVQPLPQKPIMVVMHEKELPMHLALKKADFVATVIERNQPEQGESLYIFQRPPHLHWRQGRIRIIDGNEIRTITAPQMRRQ